MIPYTRNIDFFKKNIHLCCNYSKKQTKNPKKHDFVKMHHHIRKQID